MKHKFEVLKLVLEIIALSLGVGYLLYLIIEKYYMKYVRKQIDYIIHINGTRGKSTVTRLIGTILRKNGYKTYTKVTGSKPAIIDTKGNEREITRYGRPNIKEQLKVMRMAKKDGARVLVIECMAVNPNYQYITQHSMLDANISIITNARRDHEEQMGNTIEDIAMSLSNTIPKGGILFIPNNLVAFYKDICAKNKTEIIVFPEIKENQEIDFYNENINAALGVAEYFSIPKEKALEDMRDYPQDKGVVSTHKINNHLFINGFSINDIDSIKKTIHMLDLKSMPVFLINNRADRPIRVKQHFELINELKPKIVIVAGSHYRFLKRKLKDSKVIRFTTVNDLEQYPIVFGIGNVKGEGLNIINYYNNK